MSGARRTIENPFLWLCFLLVGGSSLAFLVTQYFYLAPLPPLALGLVLLLAKQPLWGYYLILFAVPLDQYRTFSERFPSLTISKLVGVLLVIIILLHMVVRKESLPKRSQLSALIGLFLIVNILSALFSAEPVAAFDGLRQLAIATVFLAISLVLVRRKAFFGTLPKIIIISVSLGALLSLYGYFFNDPTFAMNVDSEGIKRGVGATNNPNHFALTLLFAFPFLVHYVLTYNPFRWRLFATALILLNVLALVMTFSRGAALNFAFMLVLLLYEYRRYLRPRTVGFAVSGAIAAVLIVVLFIPGTYWDRQRSMLNSSDDSVSRRLDYIEVAWDSLREDPLIGTGPDTYRYRWGQAVGEGRVAKGTGSYLKRYAHNTYLEIFIGSGILGGLLFIAILLSALKAFFIAQKRFALNGEGGKASLVGAYKISFISIIVYFLMLSSQFHKYFWISLAFSQLALLYSEGDKQPDDA